MKRMKRWARDMAVEAMLVAGALAMLVLVAINGCSEGAAAPSSPAREVASARLACFFPIARDSLVAGNVRLLTGWGRWCYKGQVREFTLTIDRKNAIVRLINEQMAETWGP